VIISPNPRLVTWYQRRSRLGFFRFFFSSHHLSFRPPSRSPLPPSRSSPPPSRPYRLRPHLRGSRPLPSRSGRRRHPDPSAAAVQISAAAAQIRPPLPRSGRRCRPDPAAAATQIRPPPPSRSAPPLPRSGRRPFAGLRARLRRPRPDLRRCPSAVADLVQFRGHPRGSWLLPIRGSTLPGRRCPLLSAPGRRACCARAQFPAVLSTAVRCCPLLSAVPAAPGRSSQQCCARLLFPAVLRQAAQQSADPSPSTAPCLVVICAVRRWLPLRAD
jgi:hypothetical protein